MIKPLYSAVIPCPIAISRWRRENGEIVGQTIDRAQVPLPDYSDWFLVSRHREGSMPKTLSEALQLFGLSEPLSPDLLESKRNELLALWNPQRYANLTNNPKKYMQMYKKGEAMTQEVHAAYHLLLPLVQKEESSPPP